MSNLALIVDAHDLANAHLERLNILLLLLPAQRERLTESQENVIDLWMFELVDEAQDAIMAAADALANLKGGAK